MADIRVNPNRMELLRLKKRAALATKGHKLLKEKRDGLMQEFLKLINDVKRLRAEVDRELADAMRAFVLAEASMVPQAVQMLKHLNVQSVSVSKEIKNVMGVHIPEFEVSVKDTGQGFGEWETASELDTGMELFRKVLPKLMKLAAIEKSAELLAQEIEKTRRRVNALEYVLIPQLKETIRYIRMKLEEQERAAILTSMVVKGKIE